MAFIATLRLPRPTFESCFGFCVVLTLFSGAVETPLYAAFGIPPVFGAPLLAIAGVAGIVAFVRLAPRFSLAPDVITPLALWCFYLLWAALSVMWSAAPGIVTAKLELLLGISTAFVVMGLCTGFAADAFEMFQKTLVALGLATAAAIFIFSNAPVHESTAGAAQELKNFVDDYQTVTQCVSLAAVAALARLLAGPRSRISAAGWGGAWLLLTIASLAGGGRGAAIGGGLAQIAVLVLAMIVNWRKPGSVRLLIALLAAPGIAAILLVAGTMLEFRGVERLLNFVNSTSDKTGRHMLWSAALRMADAHPLLGAGLASFEGSANSIESLGVYPHNVFLELLAETGIFGFVLYVSALAAAALAAVRRLNMLAFAHGAFWLGMFVYTCFEMNISGDVTARNVAFMLGLSAGLAARSAVPSARSPTPRPASN